MAITDPSDTQKRITLPLRLTLAGLWAERLTRAFWPLSTLILAVLAVLAFGLQDLVAIEVVWAVAVLAVLGIGVALVMGLRKFRAPTRAEALVRLDSRLPGRPLAALTDQGFDFSRQKLAIPQALGIIALLLVLGALSALTYGSVAALLSEMFPPKIRYSSMSIPYHIGAGYLGGFLPLIAGIIVARTGDVYAGLWYTWAVVAFGVVVAIWGLKGGPPQDFSDDHG